MHERDGTWIGLLPRSYRKENLFLPRLEQNSRERVKKSKDFAYTVEDMLRTKAQIRKIVEIKFEDLNAYDLEKADLIIEGTARSMGIEVVD